MAALAHYFGHVCVDLHSEEWEWQGKNKFVFETSQFEQQFELLSIIFCRFLTYQKF